MADETFLRLGGYQVDKTGVFDDTSITANPSGGKWEYANPSYGVNFDRKNLNVWRAGLKKKHSII